MQTFIQLSGVPGSGKSTVAALLKCHLQHCITVDLDETRSALLEVGTSFATAGPLAYDLCKMWAHNLLTQGCNVVFDSPAVHQDRAQHLAALQRQGINVWLIECRTDSFDVLDARIRTRGERLRSQRISLTQAPQDLGTVDSWAEATELFQRWEAAAIRVDSVPHAVIRNNGTLPELANQVAEVFDSFSSHSSTDQSQR